MYMSVSLHVYRLTACMSGVLESQKRASDPVELKLQMIMNHDVGLWNLKWVVYKRNNYSICGSISPASIFIF